MKVYDLFEGGNASASTSITDRVKAYKMKQQSLSPEEKAAEDKEKEKQKIKQDKKNADFTEWQKNQKPKKETMKDKEFKHFANVMAAHKEQK